MPGLNIMQFFNYITHQAWRLRPPLTAYNVVPPPSSAPLARASRPQGPSALFAAPEMLQAAGSGKDAANSPASDIWSCGVILYVMLFGRHPFLWDQVGWPGPGRVIAHQPGPCQQATYLHTAVPGLALPVSVLR